MTLSPFSKIVLILAISLPVISIVGARLVGTTGNNSLLIVMIMIIAGLVVACSLSKNFPSRLYPVLIIAISASLLFHVTMITPYPYGYDINLETYVYKLTRVNLRWNSSGSPDLLTSTYNSMLSVTILPTMLSLVSGIDGVYIFKGIYPLGFSLVPLILYLIYKKQFGERIAFFSAFFFMSNYIFYNEIVTIAKEMIAELFFVLILYLLLNENHNQSRKTGISQMILVIFFSFGLVTSHYGTSYLFLIYLSITLLFMYITKSKINRISALFLVLCLVFSLSWYLFSSGSAPLMTVTQLAENMSANFLSELFNPRARQQDVFTGLGMGPAISIGRQVGRIFSYITEILIVVGVGKLLKDHKKTKLSKEYFGMIFVSIFLLLASLAVPYFASTINVSRIFHIALFFVAPFCIIGGEAIFRLMRRLWMLLKQPLLSVHIPNSFRLRSYRINAQTKSLLVLAVLIPYFLYNTGLIYEVTGDVPQSRSLSMYRMDRVILDSDVMMDQEVVGATWLHIHIPTVSMVYADRIATRHVLASYGMKPQEYLVILYNTTKDLTPGSFVYLRRLNVVDGIMLAPGFPDPFLHQWNTSEIPLHEADKIYSNGGCEIYKNVR